MKLLSRGHIIWVLQNLLALRGGESLNKGIPFIVKGRTQTHAYFTYTAEDTGEVERRLNICGIDGLLLKLWFTLEESCEYIAKNLSLTEEDVKNRVEKALMYTSGEWPKNIGYKDYKCQRNKGG